VLQSHQIRQFYLRAINDCPDISRKQVKIRTVDQRFITLNKSRPRINKCSLRRTLIHHTPINVYASILDWSMPERVSEKSKANRAYPIRGDYVLDVDVPQLWRPWNGYATNNLYASGLQIAYDRTIAILDKIKENYGDIRIVFSGKRGFHVHVRDFKVRDWTHYDSSNPIKSHESLTKWGDTCTLTFSKTRWEDSVDTTSSSAPTPCGS
jgi:DNA primase catalytic subunit